VVFSAVGTTDVGDVARFGKCDLVISGRETLAKQNCRKNGLKCSCALFTQGTIASRWGCQTILTCDECSRFQNILTTIVY
jgi:hypothetical protein